MAWGWPVGYDEHTYVLIGTQGGLWAMDWDQTAFTTDQVLRLTGITRRKLEYWIGQGLFTPDIDEAKGRGRVRLFSFANLLEIRVAVWLRDKVSLQLMRKIVGRLRQEGLQRPLQTVSFGVIEYPMGTGQPEERRLEVVTKRADGTWESWRRSGQFVLELTVPISKFTESLKQTAARDRTRTRKVGRIERRRGVLGSTPVIAGTRVPTRAIWALAQAGYDIDRIVDNYPGLKAADVRAALKEENRRRSAASSKKAQSA